MSSNTPRLGIKKPDGSDPFLRSDFVQNWDRLDQYPGDFICTSVTRPTTWGTAQTGMRIYETDTHRHVEWTGTAWIQVRDNVPLQDFLAQPFANQASNVSAVYAVGTITVDRPSRISIDAQVRMFRFAQIVGGSATASIQTTIQCAPMINGTAVSVAPSTDGIFTRGLQGGQAAGAHSASARCYGSKDLAVGTHNVGVQVFTDNTLTGSNTETLRVDQVFARAMLTNLPL